MSGVQTYTVEQAAFWISTKARDSAVHLELDEVGQNQFCQVHDKALH